MKTQKIHALYLSLLCLFSCDSEQKINPLIGHWKGFEIESENWNGKTNSHFILDLIITEDSIKFLRFPYFEMESHSYSINGDSISTDFFAKRNIYWSANDSILTLVDVIARPDGQVKNQMKFSRTKFDNQIITDLALNGISTKHLFETKWIFWENGTKKFDTNYYKPFPIITFDSTNEMIAKKIFAFKADTFKILEFNQELLSIELISGNKRISLDYLDSVTYEFNK